MAVSIAQIMGWLDTLAPRRLAEEWDNVGLILGDPAQQVERVLLALDIDEKVVKTARNGHFQLIISHHPLIFKPVKSLRWDTTQGQLLRDLIQGDVGVLSLHTNLDAADEGVNHVLAQKLGLQNVGNLMTDKEESLVKIVVFVPLEYLEKVRLALGEAGAGHIGQYSHCTFFAKGIGSFKPLDGAKPFIGSVGKLEEAEEARLETIVPHSKLKKVLNAMIKAHPYEEVAYDLYPLINDNISQGMGRIGHLPDSLTLAQLACYVKDKLGIEMVKIVGDGDVLIKKIAVCGGTGAAMIHKAKFLGAQCLVTGDIKYHEAQDALNLGVSLIDAGHYATERPVLEKILDFLKVKCETEKKLLEVLVFPDSQDPFKYL